MHSLMSSILVISLTFQGLLIDFRIFGLPIWSLMLFLFLPYINLYVKSSLNLTNLSLRQVYYYFFILAFFICLSNLYLSAFHRAGLVLAGMIVTTIIFYEYRNHIKRFIKLIIIVILVQSLFSIFQFHSDLEFFEEFKRQAWVCDRYQGGAIIDGSCSWKTWDKGSSGTFAFPVPYGYFMLTFLPIVYPFILSFFRRKRYLNNILIGFLSLAGFYALVLSMQRGAIITTVVSIIIINFFSLKLRTNFIILLIIAFLPIIFFEYFSVAKELFTWDMLQERLTNQFKSIAQVKDQNMPGSHMYSYNIYKYYGFLGFFSILVFYAILLRVIVKHQKYSSGILPNGTLIGASMSLISYQINALFHNNGHFAADVVGFISIGYMFSLVYFISEKYHHSSYSKRDKDVLNFDR